MSAILQLWLRRMVNTGFIDDKGNYILNQIR